jgi:hypothetical protein
MSMLNRFLATLTTALPAACLLVLAHNAGASSCREGNWPVACDADADNPYDWEFVAPVCDANNPDHVFIDETADWYWINNPSYHVFCVYPGDYRDWNGGAVMNMYSKGSAANPRWIMLYDPAAPADTTHPVQLAGSRRAIMPHFRIIGGSFWNIYRMTVKGYGSNSGDMINTRGIRLSHMLIEEGVKNGFPRLVGNNGNYIFQYNVVRNIVPGPRGVDRPAFYVETCDEQPCVIVRNEIINPAADAVQVAGTTYHGGLVLDENEMYMTDQRRTECATGQYNPNGLCAANEMMVVFKDPRSEPAIPSYITNNIIHHSYHFDGKSCCTSGADPAPAIYLGSGLSGPLTNIVVENNIIYESSQGIVTAHNGTTGVGDTRLRRNLLYRIDAGRDRVRSQEALATALGSGNVEYHNLVIDGTTGLATNASFVKDHQCNVAIDAGSVKYFGVRGKWANNHAFGRTDTIAGAGYTYQGDAGATMNDDLCFTVQRLTSPMTYCIPRGKVMATSPFAACVPQ